MPQWKTIPTPSRKADYRYKHLRLLAAPPAQRIFGGSPDQEELPVRINDVVRIYMRRTAEETAHVVSVNNVSAWGNTRVLDVEWACPHCSHLHHVMIPENWIAEGKAVFVEKVEA